MKIAVIGDSISSCANGATAITWPLLLEQMIRQHGTFNIEIRNYSIFGLKWYSAWNPSGGKLLSNGKTPVDAMLADGADWLITCLGVNDRANPNAEQAALDYRTKVLPIAKRVWLKQKFFDNTFGPVVTLPTEVTVAEAMTMEGVYSELQSAGETQLSYFDIWKLYKIGMSYDKWHPTNTGRQWLSSSAYRIIQQWITLFQITRDIEWLFTAGFTASNGEWVPKVPRPSFDEMIALSA